MDVKERCPVCKGGLFMEKADGSRVCAKCGYAIVKAKKPYPAEKSVASKGSEATGVACVQCGSPAKLLRFDPDGVGVYSCTLCGHTFRKEPKASPKQEAPKEKKLDGRDIFNLAKGNTVEVVSHYDKTRSLGSGFIFSDGFILTNAHVVFRNVYDEGEPIPCKKVTVNYKGGESIPAQLVAATIREDMAILHIDQHTPNIATIAKEMPETGEAIFAVGNSNGEGMCILEGIVADQLRDVYDLPFMMTSANTVHGNSGGPIFSTKGEVVGELTLGSSEAVAMNYAIPITRIRRFIQSVSAEAHIPFKLK
ncbi:MAG: serine protease [Bacilli bacterium]|nr:serine protease [Bacilli bacterium]